MTVDSPGWKTWADWEVGEEGSGCVAVMNAKGKKNCMITWHYVTIPFVYFLQFYMIIY